ncbi:MAG: hypothetical protein AB203_01860 [Parcubacteria bacterium C7867-008]|nr:MAG: hypothetical protein AB203_01860 [Parcubacteria bacterium C7867-008]
MLVTFKEQFDNAYQAVFDKVLVAMEIANTRLEKKLEYGASVKRVKYSLAPIRVRNITIGVNRTIDQLNDAGETLLVNKNKGADFRISKKEMIQAGPLNPAETIGAEVAKKLSRYIDADVFAQVKNALQTFDTGDLTTMTSSGVAVTLSTTNLPQLLSQGRAKLRKANQDLTSLALVLDSYGGSIIEQYVMSKNIDLAAAAFKNGYAGPVGGAELYLSENLLAEAVITMASNPSNGQTFSINGFVYTFVTSIGSNPGNVLIEAGVDATRDNLIDAIHQTSGTAGVKYIAWTDVDPSYDQSNWVDLQLAAVDSDAADTITITGTGSGRLVFGGNATYTLTKNLIHGYYGKKGAIDVVIQDLAEMEMVDDPYQRAKIIRADAIYGIFTFSDGKPQFLDVLLQS